MVEQWKVMWKNQWASFVWLKFYPSIKTKRVVISSDVFLGDGWDCATLFLHVLDGYIISLVAITKLKVEMLLEPIMGNKRR